MQPEYRLQSARVEVGAHAQNKFTEFLSYVTHSVSVSFRTVFIHE
jgi:hypothetical protein